MLQFHPFMLLFHLSNAARLSHSLLPCNHVCFSCDTACHFNNAVIIFFSFLNIFHPFLYSIWFSSSNMLHPFPSVLLVHFVHLFHHLQRCRPIPPILYFTCPANFMYFVFSLILFTEMLLFQPSHSVVHPYNSFCIFC